MGLQCGGEGRGLGSSGRLFTHVSDPGLGRPPQARPSLWSRLGSPQGDFSLGASRLQRRMSKGKSSTGGGCTHSSPSPDSPTVSAAQSFKRKELRSCISVGEFQCLCKKSMWNKMYQCAHLWETPPVTTIECGNAGCLHFLSLSHGMSVRHKKELAGSPGKTFVFHETGADMAATASCLPI